VSLPASRRRLARAPSAPPIFKATSPRFASANGLKGAIYGVIIVVFVLFEPLGLYGRWLKIKLFFQLFPLYKRATFKRQKIYVKSERNR